MKNVKTVTIAIVFTILGYWGGQGLAYSSDISCLRVPMGINKNRAAIIKEYLKGDYAALPISLEELKKRAKILADGYQVLLVDALGLQPGAKVIDVGSGKNFRVYHRIMAYAGADLLCIDLNPPDVMQSDIEDAKKYEGQVIFKQGDILTESVEPASFEAVLLFSVLVQPDSTNTILIERFDIADRALDLIKDGGRIVVNGSDIKDILAHNKTEIERAEKVLKEAAEKKGLTLREMELPKTTDFYWRNARCYMVNRQVSEAILNLNGELFLRNQI